MAHVWVAGTPRPQKSARTCATCPRRACRPALIRSRSFASRRATRSGVVQRSGACARGDIGRADMGQKTAPLGEPGPPVGPRYTWLRSRSNKRTSRCDRRPAYRSWEDRARYPVLLTFSTWQRCRRAWIHRPTRLASGTLSPTACTTCGRSGRAPWRTRGSRCPSCTRTRWVHGSLRWVSLLRPMTLLIYVPAGCSRAPRCRARSCRSGRLLYGRPTAGSWRCRAFLRLAHRRPSSWS